MNLAPGTSGWLALLCASRVLSASWFVAYSAMLPLVREDWRLSVRDAAIAALPVVSWVVAVVTTRGTLNTVHPRPEGHTVFASIPAVLSNRKGMLSVWGYTFHSWGLLGPVATGRLQRLGGDQAASTPRRSRIRRRVPAFPCPDGSCARLSS